MTDKEKNKLKKELQTLRDAYAEMLVVFHSLRHYTAQKHLSTAVVELNSAIKYIEDALEER